MALRELSVDNLAVVESVRLALGDGFTVLTGETGAGKSLVVDAVALALGARAATDQVRAGTDAARIDAIFDAPELSDDDPMLEVVAAGDGSVIVRREIGADGRSMARVNDRSVTVGGLRTWAQGSARSTDSTTNSDCSSRRGSSRCSTGSAATCPRSRRSGIGIGRGERRWRHPPSC